MITYYTDGSCSPNPGPGGFAVIKDMHPAILGGEKDSTNIRMEGKALIAALEDAAGEECQIYTDSEFWINVITKWSIAWEKSGWKKKGGEIKNLDIVKEVCPLYRKSNATLTWVRGHNNDPGNELADEWANEAREQLKKGQTPAVPQATLDAPAATPEALLENYLTQGNTMQIATLQADQPWICIVYYIEKDKHFYWLSLPNRRHSLEIAKHSKVAIAIQIKTDQPVIGIQAEGTAAIVQGKAEIAEIMPLYATKYGEGKAFYENFIAGKNEHQLYKFSPTKFVLFDEVHYKPSESRKEWLAD